MLEHNQEILQKSVKIKFMKIKDILSFKRTLDISRLDRFACTYPFVPEPLAV